MFKLEGQHNNKMYLIDTYFKETGSKVQDPDNLDWVEWISNTTNNHVGVDNSRTLN